MTYWFRRLWLLVLVSFPDAQAERLVARTDVDGDGNFIAQQISVNRSGNTVVATSPITLNPPLPAGATVDRIFLANGGRHLVYGAFTGDAAIFDDLFVVDLNSPGTSTLLNGIRDPGVEAPLIFTAVKGSSNVAYALRDFSNGTDRLFVVSVDAPGVAALVFDTFPAGATIGDMEMSPDGQVLAFRLDRIGAQPQVWMSFLGRTPQSVTPNAQPIDLPAPTENYQPNEFQFSADSRRFLWRGRQTVPGQPEPLRMVNVDSDRRSISAPLQINPGTVPNEQVFEFEVDPNSRQVFYRSIAGNSTLPGDTFVAQLDEPGIATRLNPDPVTGAGFTALEDVLLLGNRVLYNSAQSRPDLVELYSVPGDGSATSVLLSQGLQLNPVSSSASRPGVSHMVASRDQAWVALIDGNPAQNLLVLDPDNPQRNFQPFDLDALGHTIELSSLTNLTRRDPFRFSEDSSLLAIPADAQAFNPGTDPPDLGAALLVALPDVSGSGRSVFPGEGEVAGYRWLDDRTALSASALPTSRSGQVNSTVTSFVAMINGGNVTGRACRILPISDVPIGFSYQPTNAQTNAVEGIANTPLDIAPGALQTWVISADILAEFPPTSVRFRFACDNSDQVPTIEGVNTLLLSGSSGPVADVVALAATPNQNGIVDLPASGTASAFSVASINVGSSVALQVEADTAGVSLPINITLCQTNATGQCINPALPTSDPVSLNVNTGATPSFSVFASASGSVASNAANNRIRVVFREPNGTVRGQTTVAVRTLDF